MDFLEAYIPNIIHIFFLIHEGIKENLIHHVGNYSTTNTRQRKYYCIVFLKFYLHIFIQ